MKSIVEWIDYVGRWIVVGFLWLMFIWGMVTWLVALYSELWERFRRK